MQQFVNHPAQWLTRLVQIPSVNPPHALGRTDIAGEGRVAEQIHQWFQQLGGETNIEMITPNRPNVYGIWRGRKGDAGRWIAIDVHTDTVGVAQMPGDPFSGEIRDGKVWGRGAVDDKASLAVILAMLEKLQHDGLKPEANLVIGATMDEEEGGPGSDRFADWLKAKNIRADLVVAEPTMCAPAYGHKGVLRMRFTIHGLAMHTSKPDLGRNAITAAVPVIQALEAEHVRLRTLPPSPVGNATLTVSMIEGGRAVNIVPDVCTITIDRRIVAGEDPRAIGNAIEQMVQQACPLRIETIDYRGRYAFYQPADSEIVKQFSAWSGMPPTIVPYGSNAFSYNADNVKSCVVLGPGNIDQAHGPEEWVEIAELEKLAGIYAKWWGI